MNRESIEKMFAIQGSRNVIPDVFEGILNLVRPAYTNVDKAHDLNHIEHVIKKGFDIYEFIKDQDKYQNVSYITEPAQAKLMIGLAGFIHDVYSHTKRKDHHIEAYKLMREISELKQMYIKRDPWDWRLPNKEKLIMSRIPGQDGSNWTEKSFEWLKHYNTDMIDIVAEMVLEHRASNQNPFSSTWCELFSAADRGDLNLEVVISRIYHSKSTETLWREYLFNNHMASVFYHLIEKFANGGYMYKKLSKDGIYMSYNKNNLEQFWTEIEDMIVNPSLFIKEYIKLDRK